ncbi:Stk1 family PASTA domain-containing Ser/Thr kinase [soil metagenome]
MAPDTPDVPAQAGGSLPSDTLRGRLLDGRYRIGSRIARGGMASVYEAHDIRLDRTVAVKVMHPGLGDSNDGDFAERFVREARAAARLSHPNVVAVYDQGNEHGTVFLVMELVPGHTLRDTISKESPMAPGRALALLEPVVSALASAHRNGLIHRDVKPENVLIADDGRVKVADFGLAKAVSAETQHTATQGVLIGTVSYLAPELVIDGRADARAEVYAAGVVLYELLTGVKPHDGETPIQVAYKHVHHDVPPPSERVPELPAYVDALVARATARDRSRRPADAAVLLHQLHLVANALANGVREDPELTQDLSPPQAPRDAGIDLGTDTAPEPWDAAEMEALLTPGPPSDHTIALHEHTSTYAVESPMRPAPEPRHPRPTRPPSSKRPRQRRSKRGLILLLAALLVAGAIGGGAFWYGWARYTAAPQVMGQDKADAVAALDAAGLEVAFTEPAYDSEVPEGSVVSADPGGGTQVLPGDTVTLTLSLGKLLVPKVRLLDEDAAQDALLAVRLEFGRSRGRYNETQPAGTVLGSVPEKGAELSPGDTVDLIVSKGRRPIKVGSWVGKDIAKARARLEKRDLVATVVSEEYDATAPVGEVLTQSPTEGTLNKCDVVSLTVSRGPEMVTVPSVRAVGIDAATERLEALGFEVDTAHDTAYLGLGFAVRTDPPSGTEVVKGSTITIYIL